MFVGETSREIRSSKIFSGSIFISYWRSTPREFKIFTAMPLMRANMTSKAAPPTNRPKNDIGRKVSSVDRKPKRSMNNNNVHGRTSVASYGSEVKFKTSFKIARKKDNSTACYKQDGERFDIPETLKLLSAVDYTVTMEICPSMELIYVKFGGIENSFQLINNPENEEKSIYQFYWSTLGIEPNLSKHRSDVISTIKFKNFKEIEFRLQVKFYREENVEHAKWGTPLNSIILECIAGRGTYDSFVEVIKYT